MPARPEVSVIIPTWNRRELLLHAVRSVLAQTRAVEEIIAAHPGGRVVAVCHAGVINAYTGAIVDVGRALWFDPGYASINRVLASRRGDRGIGSLNEMAHLRDLRVSGG
jgi:broad specificity phosphatase PhoE